MSQVLNAGDAFPEGVTFSHIPFTPEIEAFEACGIPVNYNASAGTFSSKSHVASLAQCKYQKLTRTRK
ncbi:hypothetical protein IMZ48_30190 [Candidatus Bathyarchaeota archaeon]|nr:hypothetical protein [Candidatus Bathyarchaeota archaeon]